MNWRRDWCLHEVTDPSRCIEHAWPLVSGPSFALRVVFNPVSGPGSAPDPNYVDGNGQGPLPSLHAAGAIVYGSVATGFGARPGSEIRTDIDAYSIGHYTGLVDGIFFDELSTDLARVGDGLGYAAHVALRSPTALTIGNPGTTGVVNPSGQTLNSAFDYAGVCEILVTAEETGSAYRASYASPVYLSAEPASGFAHLIHGDGAFDPALLELAANRKAGVLYVTDDLPPNPYGRLPTDWTAFLAAIAAAPPTAAPVASPLVLVILVSLLVLLGARVRSSAAGRGASRA